MRAFVPVLWFLLLPGIGAAAGANLIANPEFRAGDDGLPKDWTAWSPRPDLAPAHALIHAPDGDVLSMRSRAFASYGKWTTVVANIQPGAHYRFEVLARTEKMASEAVSVGALVQWCKDPGAADAVQTDYVDKTADAGEWRRYFRTFRAPSGVRSIRIDLVLRWTEQGAVFWKQPKLIEVEATPRRMVRVATTRIRPQPGATLESNTQLMADVFDRAALRKPDLVLFSETVLSVGVRLPLLQKAQPIPGPLTEMLSAKARKYRTWVATSLYERAEGLVYNTAVLIDRNGAIAGKYRKTHLAMSEALLGVTPGRDYPVMDTDFGRVALLICWDNWFPEVARILRLKGAEILLLPIAGDGVPGHWDVISRARAFDNGVYLITSNWVGAARIISPAGDVLAETGADGPFSLAVADIDLDREWRVPALSVPQGEGEGKSLYIKERRPDIYSVLTH